MKAILEFNLDDPEDAMNHLRCIKATNMASCLFEITKNLHRRHDGSHQIFEDIYDILDQNGVNIDDLIY